MSSISIQSMKNWWYWIWGGVFFLFLLLCIIGLSGTFKDLFFTEWTLETYTFLWLCILGIGTAILIVVGLYLMARRPKVKVRE